MVVTLSEGVIRRLMVRRGPTV